MKVRLLEAWGFIVLAIDPAADDFVPDAGAAQLRPQHVVEERRQYSRVQAIAFLPSLMCCSAVPR